MKKQKNSLQKENQVFLEKMANLKTMKKSGP